MIQKSESFYSTVISLFNVKEKTFNFRLIPMIEGEKPLSDAAFDASSYLGPLSKPQYSRLHSEPNEKSSKEYVSRVLS